MAIDLYKGVHGAPPREMERMFLDDIRVSCSNELRAGLPPGYVLQMESYSIDSAIRGVSSNLPDAAVAQITDADVATFAAEQQQGLAQRSPDTPSFFTPAFAAAQRCALNRRLCQFGRTKYCFGRPYVPSGAYTAPQAPRVEAVRPASSTVPPAPSAAPTGIDWQARGAAPGFAPNPLLARDSRGFRSPDDRDRLPLYGPSQAALDTLTTEQKYARRDAMTLYQVEKDNQAWRGHKLHYAANDMTQCMRVLPTGTKLEWGTSGKFKMVNTCSESVIASWCANRAECDGDHGNLWTLRPGMEWPIFFADPADPYIRIGACKSMGKPVPSEAQLARQGGVSTRHNDPPAAPGVGILPNHIC